jgi:hypothetical protein
MIPETTSSRGDDTETLANIALGMEKIPVGQQANQNVFQRIKIASNGQGE